MTPVCRTNRGRFPIVLSALRDTPYQQFLGLLGLVVTLYTSMIGAKVLSKSVAYTDFGYFSYQPGIVTYALYSIMAFIPALCAFTMPFRRLLAIVPLSVLALLAWAALSLSWSDFKFIGTTRLVVAASILVGTLICVSCSGPTKTLKLLGLFLGTVLVLDWISLPLLPQSSQLTADPTASPFGWRGLHSHKNIAGVVAALATLYYFSSLLSKPRWSSGVFFCLALAFLWGTQSRTSLAATGAVCLLLLALYGATRSQISGQLLRIGAAIASVAILISILVGYSAIIEYLSNPAVFNGRGALWLIIVHYLQDHFWLGSGFGSFWRVGVDGPTLQYSLDWAGFSYNGHNGYLDAFVTMGAVGFCLVIFVFVINPIMELTRLGKPLANHQGLCAVAFIVFPILQNLLESTILVMSSPAYVGWIVGYGLSRAAVSEAKSERRLSFWELQRLTFGSATLR